MHDNIFEERKKSFQKVNWDIVEARQNHKLSLRKEKVEEMITKRRLAGLKLWDKKEYEIDPSKLNVTDEMKNKEFLTFNEFYEFANGLLISHDNIDLIKLGIFLLRHHVTSQKEVHTNIMRRMNLFETLSNLIEKFIKIDTIIYEILWILSNTSNSEDKDLSKLFMTENYLKIYMLIINEYEKKNQIILDTLINHLGNHATDDTHSRDELIKYGIHDRIVKILLSDRIHEGVVKTGIWFISLCLKHRPHMEEERVFSSLEVCFKFLESEDKEVENDAIWGISYGSETEHKSIIKLFINSNLCQYLICSDNMKNKNYIVPIVRIFGNLLSDEPEVTDYLLSIDVISLLTKFLTHKFSSVRREVLWAISNICAGNLSHLKFILSSGIIKSILFLFKDEEHETVREAIYCISNLINGGNLDICMQLVDFGVIPAIMYILRNKKHPDLLELALMSVFVFLEHGRSYMSEENPFVKVFVEQEGDQVLEHLQFYKNDTIFGLVEKILNNYFSIQIVSK